MFKRKVAVITSIMLALVMSASLTTFAADSGYLALGADLSAEEQATVLELLGVDDINNYDVLYITNEDEHKYLDGYVDAAQIGTQSLSSVYLKEKIGKGINIELHNIGYCTEEMYRNALVTAGVSGVDVVVAGPYEISGTAALVGAIKLFEEAKGVVISDEVIDAAVEELTTTGELNQELGDDNVAQDIIAYVKDKLAEKPNMSDEELENLIREAGEAVGKALSSAQVEKIKNMLEKMQGVDINWGNIKNQSSEILKNIVNAFDKDEAEREARGIFSRFIAWIRNKF